MGMCVPDGVYVHHVYVGADRSQKRAPDALELEFTGDCDLPLQVCDARGQTVLLTVEPSPAPNFLLYTTQHLCACIVPAKA